MISKPLTSERREADDFAAAMELPYALGWSDGLPVVPPTENRVMEFLDESGLEPDQVVAEITERDRHITAEKVAINAVMAGCLPEYMPVVVAALQAMAEPRFKFNHLASLGSPWPLIVVNGPIARRIGLYSGIYLFGPGSRPNLTIGRAVSLVLRNCAEAKVEGIQRGQWGNSIRFASCIAENEETGWTPLNVQRGFDREQSTVTVASTYPGSPLHVTINLFGEKPERMLNPVCDTIAHYHGAQWSRGTYVLLVGPHMVEMFVRAGWSKQDVRDYIVDNTRASIANLKYRGTWGFYHSVQSDELFRIEPGDEEKMLYLFKSNGDLDRYPFLDGNIGDRDLEILVVVAGGDAGARMAITVPYQVSTNSVTKPIMTKAG